MSRANMENAKVIARSLKLKVELEEEKNAMKAFSLAPCETEEDNREKAEYFRMVRRRYFRRAQERENEEMNNNSQIVEEDAAHNNQIHPVDETNSNNDRHESTIEHL